MSASASDRRPVPHVLSSRDFDKESVDRLCASAKAMADGGARPGHAGRSVALFFFQPSTRTRLGFEVATFGVGAAAIGMDDMSASRSNARTGESLEDLAAVVSRYADAIVLRHHERGAAARMAAKSIVPVINAGDGFNEHPTQALADILSIRESIGVIEGKAIGIGGDPRGRTVRSLCHLLRLERPRAVLFCPPPHIPVPEDVIMTLRQEGILVANVADVSTLLRECAAVMMGPYDMSDVGEAAGSGYVSPRSSPDSHVITAEKVLRFGPHTCLFHPLPRQDEIAQDCDELPNARYFEQVRLSKFMRMAILDAALSRA